MLVIIFLYFSLDLLNSNLATTRGIGFVGVNLDVSIRVLATEVGFTKNTVQLIHLFKTKDILCKDSDYRNMKESGLIQWEISVCGVDVCLITLF